MVLQQKKNIFLDLDHTLICSEEYTSQIMEDVYKYSDHAFIEPYVTVARPNLQKFLDYLFANYNVCIWTAASKNYASFIYDRFIKFYNRNRCLKLLLYNVHCEMSSDILGGSKKLSMLWEQWNLPGFNEKNTYIIDDLKEVFTIQPTNCIRIKPFKIKGGEYDNELERIIDYLRNIN